MNRFARPHPVPAALILLGLATVARAQINVRGTGPLGPGRQQTDVGPEDPAKKAERVRRSAEQAMRKADEHREKGRIQPAVTAYKSALSFAVTPGPDGQPVDSGIASSAVAQLKQIYDEGRVKLDEARQAYKDGKYVDAAEAARKIRVIYAGVLSRVPGGDRMPNVADLAAALTRDIESDPAAVPALQQARAEPLIRRLARLDRDAKRDPEKRLDQYLLLQTLAQKHPQCEAGRDATKRLAEMRNDASLMAWIDAEIKARRIRSELAIADQYARNGQLAKAEEIHAKLLRRHPGKSLDELRAMARP